MSDSNPVESDFLNQITSIIEKNLSNEQLLSFLSEENGDDDEPAAGDSEEA